VPTSGFRYTHGFRGAPSLCGSSPLSMARIKKSPLKPVPRARGKELSASKATRELEELNRVGIALSENSGRRAVAGFILKRPGKSPRLTPVLCICGERQSFRRRWDTSPAVAVQADGQNDSVQFLSASARFVDGKFHGRVLRAAWRSDRASRCLSRAKDAAVAHQRPRLNETGRVFGTR